MGCFGGSNRGLKWTKQQWGVMATLGISHFFNGMTVSLQAPFYPAEAESKGASAAEYGLVFGIFQLTAFFVSPIIGKFLPRIGIGRAFYGGLFLTGLLCILFGLLNRVEGVTAFIALSFLVRILTAFGYSAFLASSFTLVAKLFPETVATVFALVEMSFGVGMIIGPTVGGALYEAGGFTMPFGVLGGLLLGQALIATQTLPELKDSTEDSSPAEGFGLLAALKIPSVAVATFAVFSGSIAVGALQATLERHLAQFDLTTMEVGFFFMLYGGAYALPNPLWGWIADKFSPKIVILVGSFLLVVGHLLVGPIPGIGLAPSYELCVVAVIVAGVGLGAQLVATFSEAQRSAVARGFPNDVSTYSMVSSIWTSSFALGAFVGPTASGALSDVVGFRWAMVFTAGWNMIVFFLTLGSMMASKFGRKAKSGLLYQKIEGGNYGSVSTASKNNFTSEVEAQLQKQDRYQTL